MLYDYRVTYNPMFLSVDSPSVEGQRWIKGRVDAESKLEACEKLFELFNTGNQPPGYRSMSVGDFVALREHGAPAGMTAFSHHPWYYFVCAPQGWQEVHESEFITR